MRVDPACPAEIVPVGPRVPLVGAEMLLALDNADLVPVGRAHDRALSVADRAVATPEIANRPVDLEFHRAAVAGSLLDIHFAVSRSTVCRLGRSNFAAQSQCALRRPCFLIMRI